MNWSVQGAADMNDSTIRSLLEKNADTENFSDIAIGPEDERSDVVQNG